MASSLVDLVKINITSTGTGPLKLGSAVTGFRGTDALTNGRDYSYSIQQGANWEVGRGTWLSASSQMVRQVLYSSNGGIAIALKTGAQVSFVPISADLDAVQLAADIQAVAAQTQANADVVAANTAAVQEIANNAGLTVNAAESAASAAGSAATATTAAAQAVAAALGLPLFPILNASTAVGGSNVLPKGITSGTIGGTAITGATPGTYALTPTGGSFTGVQANLVVTSATAATIQIVSQGRTTSASPTAPTWANPAGATLPGGTTLTANIGDLIGNGTGQYYLTPDGSGNYLLYWQNSGGAVTAVNDVKGVQLQYPLGPLINAILLATCRWQRQVAPVAPITTGTIYSPTTGAGSANASYKAVTLALTGSELGLRATARINSTGGALACYYDASDVFISSQFTGTGSSVNYINQVLTVPATARKVIICGLAVANIGIDVLTAISSSTLADQATIGNQAGLSLASAVDSGVTPTTGSYVNTFGIITAAGGYKYLEYTVTARDISFTATGTTSGSAMVLAAYIDANGEMISSKFTGGGSPVVYTNQALTVPFGTAKIRLSGTSSATLALNVTQVPASAASLIAAAQVSAIRGNAAASVLDAFQGSGITPTTGSYVAANGSLVTNASYQYLDYTLDSTETGFQVSAVLAGGATQLANYLNAAGASIGTQFTGTGSNVTYSNQTLTVPNGTAKIRLCGLASSALSLSVKKPLANAGALIQSGSGNSSISVIGDSMAFMLAPFVAALYPSRTTYNEGIGGQTTQHVAARMGALQVTTTGAITLPTSGTVAVTPSIDLLYSNRSSAWSCRVMVLGIECWLVCAITTGAYTLKPVSYPASPLTVPAGTNIRVISGVSPTTDPSNEPLLKTMLSGTVVVRASRNDTALIGSGSGRTTVLGYMQAIANQVAAYKGNLLLMTGTNGTIDMPVSSGLPGASASDAASADGKLAGIAAFNALLLSTFPDTCIDPLANHVMRGGSTNQTPVSTTYAVLNSTVLDTDGLHENTATGRPQTAAFVQSFITSRGY